LYFFALVSWVWLG